MAFSVTRMPLCFVKDNRSDLHHGVGQTNLEDKYLG